MDAIDIAMKMETDAIGFYKEASEKTTHPVGKKMFLSIMEDEKRHIDMLNDLLKGMDIAHENIDPMDKIRTVFGSMKNRMHAGITATANELDALETAMKMEKEGFEFYKKVAAESPDPKTKALFERLVIEEEKHYGVLSNTHSFLTDTGNWFMWEERGIVDGGTPTA